MFSPNSSMLFFPLTKNGFQDDTTFFQDYLFSLLAYLANTRQKEKQSY